MKKPKEQTKWQQNNKEKVNSYTQKYLKDKVRATVILTLDIAEKIDKVKPAEQTYGSWIRELVENHVSEIK